MSEKPARRCSESDVNTAQTNRLSAACDKTHRSSPSVTTESRCVGVKHEREKLTS